MENPNSVVPGSQPPPYIYADPNNGGNYNQMPTQTYSYLPYANPGYVSDQTEKHMPINYNQPPSYTVAQTPFNQNIILVGPSNIQMAMNQVNTEQIYDMRYSKLHLIYGTMSIILGGIIMIIDPLLPAIFQYIYSIFCVGLFMMISGICSILGSRRQNKCCLVASLTFNIFASILIFAGYVIGLLVASFAQSTNNCEVMNCLISGPYVRSLPALGIFNSIFGIIIFVFIIWDSSLKCGDVCCIKMITRAIASSPNIEVINNVS